MKKGLFIILCLFLYSSSAWAGDCNTTISTSTTSKLTCSANDELTITSSGTIEVGGTAGTTTTAIDGYPFKDNLTINNAGTISGNGNYPVSFRSSDNSTMINSGTIFGQVSVIYLRDANNFTLTNESTGKIYTTYANTIKSQEATDGIVIHNYGKIYGGETGVEKQLVITIAGGTDANQGPKLYNYSGGEIKGWKWGFHATGSDCVIDNAGTIQVVNLYAIESECADTTLTNSGTIKNTTDGVGDTISFLDASGVATITNSGTIETAEDGAINLSKNSNAVVTNTGTITADDEGALEASNHIDLTFTNSGTLTAADATLDLRNAYTSGSVDNGSGATVINSGTITATAGDAIAIGTETADDSRTHNNATITNKGTISATDNSIIISEATTGTNIVVDEEATFTGEIEMNSTATTVTLSCTLTKDLDIEIHNKTSMTVTNNLCGNDTYEILDASLNADADNSETNGYIRIYGEDLEIAQNNPKYRSENVLTKLRGLFDAANYINWHAPEDKMFKIFHSEQKREGTYKGTMSGVVGQLSPFILGDIRNNFFVGYTQQNGDFDNGEFLGGDNFALGLKSVYENNGFKASFTPMVGVNDLTVTDYDTDTKTSISTNLFSEFAGINTKLGKDIELSEEGSLNLSIQSTLGLQRFPDYLAKFGDGDLSVDEAIEQVLSLGFEVKYIDEVAEGFIVQPYAGININNNLNNSIKITADGENKNVSPASSSATGYFAGLSITKNLDKDLNFDFELSYSNEDGLINEVASVSLVKYFRDKPKNQIPKLDVRDIRKKLDLEKIDKNLTAQNDNKEEKLNVIIKKTIQENLVSKHLIKELIKEVERLTLTNKIFKNKIIENETRSFKNKIFEIDYTEINKAVLIGFLLVMAFALYGFLIFIASTYKKIVFKLAN